MTVNSSFADTPHLPSNSSLSSLDCLTFRISVTILTTYCLTNILLIVPLSALIFYLGYQRRRQIFSVSPAKAAISHSDIVTYHIHAMEMIAALGCLLFCVGVNTKLPKMITHCFNIFFATWCVKIVFHALTCVELYLAVVHPVTYLGLKSKSCARMRNISIGCVWLLCFLWGIFLTLTNTVVNLIIYYCLLAFGIIIVCFCCISVLCALKRPGPGEVAKHREKVDQRKQRAFRTVMSIMGVSCLCLGGILVRDATVDSQRLNDSDKCAMQFSGFWFSLPTSLVLPLLYLHRAGKLPGCKQSTN